MFALSLGRIDKRLADFQEGHGGRILSHRSKPVPSSHAPTTKTLLGGFPVKRRLALTPDEKHDQLAAGAKALRPVEIEACAAWLKSLPTGDRALIARTEARLLYVIECVHIDVDPDEPSE